jgi:hypothetical protein
MLRHQWAWLVEDLQVSHLEFIGIFWDFLNSQIEWVV